MLSLTIDPIPPAPPIPPEAPAAPVPPAPAAANLFFRHDTMLGICEAVGQDFGFNPNWLRIAFGAVLVFAPVAVIASYLGLGVIVAVSRWLSPNRAPATRPVAADAAFPGAMQDLAAASDQRLAA